MPPKQLCALHLKALAVCMPPKKLCALHFKGLAVCMPPKQLCALQWRYGYRRNQTGGNPPAGENTDTDLFKQAGPYGSDLRLYPIRGLDRNKKERKGQLDLESCLGKLYSPFWQTMRSFQSLRKTHKDSPNDWMPIQYLRKPQTHQSDKFRHHDCLVPVLMGTLIRGAVTPNRVRNASKTRGENPR